MKMNLFVIMQMMQNGPWALNGIVESNLYNSWNDGYARLNLKNRFDDFKEQLLKEGFNLDELKECDGVTLRDFGLKVWCNLDDKTDLWVFPVWMYEVIPEGYKVVDINGETEEFHHETAERDQRLGCLSFGFALPRERYEELKEFHEKLKAKCDLNGVNSVRRLFVQETDKKELDKTEEK